MNPTSRLIQRRATLQFEFGLPSPQWMAYTFVQKNRCDQQQLSSVSDSHAHAFFGRCGILSDERNIRSRIRRSFPYVHVSRGTPAAVYHCRIGRLWHYWHILAKSLWAHCRMEAMDFDFRSYRTDDRRCEHSRWHSLEDP